MKSGITRIIRCEVVVEAAVDVREAEDDVRQLVAARVRVDERLAGDLRGGVRALGVGEVGRAFLGLEPVHVAVDLAARAEDDGVCVWRQYSSTLKVIVMFSSAGAGSRTSWCTFAWAARWTTTSAAGYSTPPMPPSIAA